MPQLSHLRAVLHIEDELLLSMTTDVVLHDAGVAKVLHAATCESAIALVESESIDAAIVDMQLRDGDSHLVLQKLTRKQIPFIIVSGAPPLTEGNEFEAYRLNKPVSKAQLVTALERITADQLAAR